jgi:hypothetical protein
MKKHFSKQMGKILATLFLSVSIFISAFPQPRGNFSFASPPAMVLKQSTRIKQDIIEPEIEKGPSIFNQLTVSSVGGISFGKTASMDPSPDVKSVNISYAKDNPDGERLVLLLNGKPAVVKVYDWMLIPIARFADSEYNSVFTYFGKLQDKDLEQTVLDNKGHILNYHPAFQNTLLGWRLADMDMLIMYDFTSDLPKVNNRVILGPGESQPDVEANKYGAYKFSGYVNEIQRKLGYPFQSYIITDYSRKIEVSVLNDSLTISGFPYYYCWHYRDNEPDFDINKLAADISKEYKKTIQLETSKNTGFDLRELFIDSLIIIAERYEGAFNLYQSGTFNDLIDLRTADERKEFLRRYSTESLSSMAIEVTAEMAARTPLHLKYFSDRMSAFPDMIKACNPAVWNATVTTMRMSAFFRYIKENDSEGWNRFMQTISVVEITPRINTPTVLYEKGNGPLEKIFH